MNASTPRHAFTPAAALSSGADAMAASARIGSKMLAGSKRLGRIRDADVDIATTPKDLVWSQDKVTLHRYRPLSEQRVRIPLLVTYGLIGRWTMTDLQDDRSLVRNLLNLGVDLYVVDWGNPSRADRYLTMDDYICGYLDRCVEEVARLSGVEKVNLFGLCEGGVFATCYAALEPERVNAMALAITPIDFHADMTRNRLGFGLINVWTRSLPAEDVDRLIEAHGNVPGKFFGAMFNQLTPMRTALKYNFDMLDVTDDEQRLLNWLRMEKWIADRPDHPGEAARQWMIELYQQKQADPQRAGAGRPPRRPQADHHAGAERVRQRRPYHSGRDQPGIGTRDRHQRVRGAGAAGRPCRHLRRRPLAAPVRAGARGLHDAT